jgi:IstB-like ATP binding protein
LEHASVKQYCKALRMPAIGSNLVRLSEQAIKEQRSHIGYLEALLAMEAEERDRHAIQKRLHDTKVPRLKTLESSTSIRHGGLRQRRFASWPTAATSLAPSRWRSRANGQMWHRQDAPGHGLGVAACLQKRRARFTRAANLVNELVEAWQHNTVKCDLARSLRYDVIVLDEGLRASGSEIGAEFLFRVIAERAERDHVDRDHEPPAFGVDVGVSESAPVQSLLDRITDRAHIIETGTESYRFRRTLGDRAPKKSVTGSAA